MARLSARLLDELGVLLAVVDRALAMGAELIANASLRFWAVLGALAARLLGRTDAAPEGLFQPGYVPPRHAWWRPADGNPSAGARAGSSPSGGATRDFSECTSGECTEGECIEIDPSEIELAGPGDLTLAERGASGAVPDAGGTPASARRTTPPPLPAQVRAIAAQTRAGARQRSPMHARLGPPHDSRGSQGLSRGHGAPQGPGAPHSGGMGSGALGSGKRPLGHLRQPRRFRG